MTEYRVGVRALAGFCYRSGDIDHRFTPSPSGEQGVEGHREIYRRRGEGYKSEYPVQHRCQLNGVDLLLRGRADGYDEAGGLVEEIKTTRIDATLIPAAVENMHLAQARLYAALIARELELPQLDIRLTWYNVDSGQEWSRDETCDRTRLDRFLSDTLQRFSGWLATLARLRDERNASVQRLDFPYGEFRAGQRGMAELVYKCSHQGGQLLLEAPTGIGKTSGVIYPALKAVAADRHDKLVFLTARHVGRLAAEQTLGHFRQSGLAVQALSLTAKERICLSPGRACQGDDCSYAKGYYDKLPAALDAAMQHQALRQPELEMIAREHAVCPHQLSLDLLPWVDMVIADVHYAYSPWATLGSLLATGAERWSFLLDEAHNLPGRARGMYSASLAKAELMAARRASSGAVKKALDRINRELLELAKLDWDDDERHLLPDCPERLAGALQAFVGECSVVQAEQPLYLQERPALRDMFFTVVQFQKILEYWGQEYRCELRRDSGAQSLVVRLNCLDAARLLGERSASLHSLTAFSATLSPLPWMAASLGLSNNAVLHRLASPFAPEQLQVRVDDSIDTRFRQRAASLPALAAAIRDWLQQNEGNCIVYFPSYRYMADCLTQLGDLPDGRRLWQQGREQDDSQRAALLQLLRTHCDVVAFCILGGVFGEGVDLPGDQLSSVIIVGVGLPQFNADTEAQRDYFQTRFGDGFAHAYLYPGLQKVAQALGRVVRSESDTGTALLLDSRYRERRYRDLLPCAWAYRES